jgi:hypothetical protein
METLTDGEVLALRNLAEKQTGVVTSFVNIADARRLTELGLATRGRQGWDISSAGAAYLAAADGDGADTISVTAPRLVGGGGEGDAN